MKQIFSGEVMVWCPHCGEEPGVECPDTTERTAALLGIDAIKHWTWPSLAREAELEAMPYRNYLRTAEWSERRQVILARAGYRCEDCGDTSRLQVHHLTYERRGREWPSDLMVLCDRCHTACHPSTRRRGASMSYGAYVQACIDERRRKTIGHQSWDYAARKYASDNFPDFPEDRVVEILADMRWPDRPVTVREVHKVLKDKVTAAEIRRWEQETYA